MPDKRERSDELVERIRPLLAGEDPDVIGVTLGELAAIWLAGHQADDPTELRKFREEIFAAHLDYIWSLVELYDDAVRRLPKNERRE